MIIVRLLSSLCLRQSDYPESHVRPYSPLPQVMVQRLLPILANLPCAVTLLDLESGPVYQNGPSLRSVKPAYVPYLRVSPSYLHACFTCMHILPTCTPVPSLITSQLRHPLYLV